MVTVWIQRGSREQGAVVIVCVHFWLGEPEKGMEGMEKLSGGRGMWMV